MLAFVRNLKQNYYNPSTQKVDKSILSKLPPQFQREFAPIENAGNGNCYYNSVSISLCGSDILHEVLRLLTLAIAVKYRDKINRHVDPFD